MLNSVTRESSTPTLNQTIVDARLGCEEARNRLCEQFRGYLNTIASAQIGPHFRRKFDASDIVQMTLAEACEDFDQFSGDAQNLRSWLSRILVTNLIDLKRQFTTCQRRSLAREQGLGEIDIRSDQATASTILQKQERNDQLRVAVAHLPPCTRELLNLRHRDGLSFDQIGERLGISSAAARKRWSRTLAALREQLSRVESND